MYLNPFNVGGPPCRIQLIPYNIFLPCHRWEIFEVIEMSSKFAMNIKYTRYYVRPNMTTNSFTFGNLVIESPFKITYNISNRITVYITY